MNQIIIRPKESILGSIFKDTYSFGIMIFSFWFNQNYIGGSYVVNAILLFLFTMSLIGVIMKHNKNNTFPVSEKQMSKIKKIIKKEV